MHTETESKRRRSCLGHNSPITPAGIGETAAVSGNGGVADHELLQNDSAATIGNAQGISNVTDSSPADPAKRSETLDERHRRLDGERK